MQYNKTICNARMVSQSAESKYHIGSGYHAAVSWFEYVDATEC